MFAGMEEKEVREEGKGSVEEEKGEKQIEEKGANEEYVQNSRGRGRGRGGERGRERRGGGVDQRKDAFFKRKEGVLLNLREGTSDKSPKGNFNKKLFPFPSISLSFLL